MDPKALSNIDPKLKETYERVMGTPTPPAASTPTAPSFDSSPNPAADQAASAQSNPTLSPPPAASAAQPVNPWQTAQAAPVAATTGPNPFAPSGQSLPSPASVIGHKEASPLLRVLYIVGAVIFFAVYTVFWIKVFKLPFLF